MAANVPSENSTAPLANAPRGVGRQRLSVRAELLLALLPTATVLAVLFIVRGLGLGIPYLSPQLTPTAPAAHLPQPRSVHYCH